MSTRHRTLPEKSLRSVVPGALAWLSTRWPLLGAPQEKPNGADACWAWILKALGASKVRKLPVQTSVPWLLRRSTLRSREGPGDETHGRALGGRRRADDSREGRVRKWPERESRGVGGRDGGNGRDGVAGLTRGPRRGRESPDAARGAQEAIATRKASGLRARAAGKLWARGPGL